MKANLLMNLMIAAATSGLVACGNSDAGFEPNAGFQEKAQAQNQSNYTTVTERRGDLVSIGDVGADAQVSVVSSDGRGTVGSVGGSSGTVSGGSVGTGIVAPIDPGQIAIPEDLAGTYEYQSATLSFKLSLINKQKVCSPSPTACVYIVPNVHYATVEAKGQCQASGDEQEKFIYVNETAKAGSIKFANFIATVDSYQNLPCDKTVQATRLLQQARSFRIDASGNLTITLSTSRTLRLKAIPIDWGNIKGL